MYSTRYVPLPDSDTTPRTLVLPGMRSRSVPVKYTMNWSPQMERALPYSSRATMVKLAGWPAMAVRRPAPSADEARALVRPASTVAWNGEPIMWTPPSWARTRYAPDCLTKYSAL